MRDKPVHIDDKFTQKAWADMRSLLDQEMPVQPEKRRRLLGWWLLALLGISVLAGATYLILGKKTMTEVSSNQPIATSTLPTASFNKTAQNAIVETEHTLNFTNNSKSKNPVVFDKHHTSIYQSDKRLMKSKLNNNIIEKTESRDAIINANNGDFQHADNIVLIGAEEITDIAVQNTRPMYNVDFLAQKSMNLPINSSEPTLLVASDFTKKHQWEWALQASALAIPNLSGGGFAIEANAIKAMANKRLNTSMGLGYNLLSQPIYAYSITPVNSATTEALDNGIVYENSTKTAFEGRDPNNELSIKNRALKLHYLTVPVQFAYRLTNRINVKAGVSAGLLLASQSGYTTDGIISNFTITNQDQFFGSSAKTKVSIFDIATTAGFSFVCSPNLSLQLDYVHGMTDVLPKNSVGDFNRLLKLGISYKLNGRH